MKKTVHVCIYTRRDEETPIWDYAYLLVEEGKDINIWSFPDKNLCKQLNGLSVDMLVDLTSNEAPIMRYLMLQGHRHTGRPAALSGLLLLSLI